MNSSAVRILGLAVAASMLAAGSPAPSSAQTGLQYHSLTPCRIADTRNITGPILNTGVVRTFTIQTGCSVPTGARAVSINVTAVGPTGAGFLTLFPATTTQPTVSNINFAAFEPALGNGAIVPLHTATPDLAVFPFVNAAGGTVHMVIDVTGYFQ